MSSPAAVAPKSGREPFGFAQGGHWAAGPPSFHSWDILRDIGKVCLPASMVKKTGILLLALLLPSALYGSCKPVQIEKADADFPALRAKKIEYALSVIENGRYLAHERSCVSAAMRYLGEAHVEAAIPQLVRLLNFAVPTPQCDGPGPIVGGVGTGCGPNGPYPWVKYPALDALHRIGKPAAPALIKAMAATPVTSTSSKNALDAFMDVYRENLGQGIRALQLAAAKQTDPMAKSRLIEASEDAHSIWCRSSPCNQ